MFTTQIVFLLENHYSEQYHPNPLLPSRLTPAKKPRVQTDLSDVVPVEEPAEEPLHTQPVASVHASAETTLVRVILER